MILAATDEYTGTEIILLPVEHMNEAKIKALNVSF